MTTGTIESVDEGAPASVAVGGRPRVIALARDYAILGSLVALFLVLSLSSDVFLTKTNLLNIMDQAVFLGIVAAGGTLVIVAGGFDLSVGAVFAVAGVVAAHVANEFGAPLGLLAGPAVGLGFGVINGLLVTVGRITPFLATLGSAIILGGLGTILTGGYVVGVENVGFTVIGRGHLVGIKNSIWLCIAFVLGAGLFLARTTLGRAIYAVGANQEVARLSGLRVSWVRTATFAVSGLGAGLAGTISASNFAIAQTGIGESLTLTAIAAIAIGGTSVLGGEGAMWRTVVGVLILTLLQNGFNLLNVQPAYRDIATGAIIIIAVAGDALSRRRRW